MIILWVLGAVLLNYLFGCVVYTYIDKDEKLLEWVDSAPLPTLASFVVPMMWPVVLVFWWKNKRS